MMKSKKYMLVVLSIFLISIVFVSSAGAADVNSTNVLSVDESANGVNEKLALDYRPVMSGESSDTNVLEKVNNETQSNDEILGTSDFEETLRNSPIPTNITVNNNTLDLKVGDTFKIVAETSPSGLNVTYDPDDSGVYNIDDEGVDNKFIKVNEIIKIFIVLSKSN